MIFEETVVAVPVAVMCVPVVGDVMTIPFTEVLSLVSIPISVVALPISVMTFPVVVSLPWSVMAISWGWSVSMSVIIVVGFTVKFWLVTVVSEFMWMPDSALGLVMPFVMHEMMVIEVSVGLTVFRTLFLFFLSIFLFILFVSGLLCWLISGRLWCAWLGAWMAPVWSPSLSMVS